ncbi:hypothetical protein [Kistimonas asteriae]|uniref:hypothetical protein n=1 Tax=Kistimonas asteriae TaxID=517724 RepID=UPI001BA92B57|nr:hypothetical protein [Kistimonas asteriae]
MKQTTALISILFLLLQNQSAIADPISIENDENLQNTKPTELLIRFVSGAEFDATIYFGDADQNVENLKRVWTFYNRQYQLWLPVGTRVLVITYAPIPTGWELLASLMTGDLDIPEEVVCHYFTVQSEGFSTVDYRGTYTYPVFHISDPNVFKPLFNSEDNHVSTSGTCQWPHPVYENVSIQE